MLIVDIPQYFKRETMYSLLGEVITKDLEPSSRVINFNFSKLKFIEPVGVTVLSNLIEWLIKREVDVFFSNYERQNGVRNCAMKYLDDSNFFKKYLSKHLSINAETRSTTRPLEHITYAKSYQWLNIHFIPWLSMQLGVSSSSMSEIKVCIEEIFNNIEDHSTENIGCIYAQYYPSNSEVKVAISDFGIGIPTAIRKKFPSYTDESALKKAVEEGFTTQTTPRNRGAGLASIITSIARTNRGIVHIHSNGGIITCNYENDELQVVSNYSSGYYPGTLFEIILNTENIFDNEEEEFEW